jgi:hypothetical protein
MEKNNYIVNCNFGSGVFSRFTLGIQELIKHPLDNLDQVYFDYQGTFNYVFEQSFPLFAKIIHTHKDISAYNGDGLLPPNNKVLIDKIISKLKIHPDIKVNPQITNRTLGIHIRLTDLMTADVRYNQNPYTTEDIIESTYKIMESGDYDNIFIASDNIESLEKFDKKFNFIHNSSQFIYHQEVDPTRDSDYLWLERFETPQEETKAFVQEAFLDMYSLSKCGGLIRIGSNLAVASLMFSNTIDKVYGYKYSN